jgi:hypothetical protein
MVTCPTGQRIPSPVHFLSRAFEYSGARNAPPTFPMSCCRRYLPGAPDPMANGAVEADVGVGDKGHDVGDLESVQVGDLALQRRENRAAEDGHHQQRKGVLTIDTI